MEMAHYIKMAWRIRSMLQMSNSNQSTNYITGSIARKLIMGIPKFLQESIIPLWKELEYYKEFQRDLRKHPGEDRGNQVLSEAWYIISVRTNDFPQNYSVVPKRTSESSVKDYQHYLLGIADDFITKLYHLGARKISVVGLRPLGCFPLERIPNIMFGGGCVEKCNNLAKNFNEKWKALIAKLSHKLARIRLVFSNTYDILWNIIHNVDSLGFEDVSTACCGIGLFEIGFMCEEMNPFTCSDANNYVFWDALHPTAKTNGIIANDLVKNYLAKFL